MQKTAYSPLYNNDVTSEYLRDLDRPPVSEEALATFSPAALAQVRESEAYKQAPPLHRHFPGGGGRRPHPQWWCDRERHPWGGVQTGGRP